MHFLLFVSLKHSEPALIHSCKIAAVYISFSAFRIDINAVRGHAISSVGSVTDRNVFGTIKIKITEIEGALVVVPPCNIGLGFGVPHRRSWKANRLKSPLFPFSVKFY